MNRYEFFDKIPAMKQNKRRQIQWAYDLSKKYFEGHERDSGERYYNHVVRVAGILIDHGYIKPRYIITGILHDTPEDTYCPLSMLERLFGPRTTRHILSLSKSYCLEDPLTGKLIRCDKKPLAEYFASIKRDGECAIVVKAADRIDNLSDLTADIIPERWTPEKRIKQVAETRDWILPLVKNVEPRFEEKLIHLCNVVELRAKQDTAST